MRSVEANLHRRDLADTAKAKHSWRLDQPQIMCVRDQRRQCFLQLEAGQHFSDAPMRPIAKDEMHQRTIRPADIEAVGMSTDRWIPQRRERADAQIVSGRDENAIDFDRLPYEAKN